MINATGSLSHKPSISHTTNNSSKNSKSQNKSNFTKAVSSIINEETNKMGITFGGETGFNKPSASESTTAAAPQRNRKDKKSI